MRDFFQQDDTLMNPFFIAKVEDNNDPTGNYRIKVRIPQVHHGNISTANLPWAAKLAPSFLGSGGSGSNHCVPEIGSEVLVIAVGNNLNSLIYLGILCHKESVTPSGEAYGGSYGIYMASGQFIGVDKITQTLKMIYQGHINVDKIIDGKIAISDKLSVTCPKINITGDVTITGELKVSKNITAEGEVEGNGIQLSTHIHAGTETTCADGSPWSGSTDAPTKPGQG